MPASNPFAPLIDVGGGASVGPASGSFSTSLGAPADHHAAAGYVLLGLLVLIALHKWGHFRFSTTVG